MSHYGHMVWEESHKGSWHLFGHSHGSLKGLGKSMDVGVDTHNEFRPYTFNEIKKNLQNKPIIYSDYHSTRTMG